MKDIVSILKQKQEELSRRYKELEEPQSEIPHAYNIIQSDMQRIDDMNEHYRRAIYDIEVAEQFKSEVV